MSDSTATLTTAAIAQQWTRQFERLMMLQELTRLAIDALPNSTDSDTPLALLNGMKELLGSDIAQAQRLVETLSAQTAIDANPQPPTLDNIGLAMDLMDDELAKLLCLAIVLANRLEPKDPKNPSDHEDLISWNLAQVLSERLGDTRFCSTMRKFLHVPTIGETA